MICPKVKQTSGFLIMLGFGVMAACTPAPTDFDKAVAAYRDNRFADARPLIIAEANAGNRDAMAMVLSQSLFLMNLESCRSLNLWSQFFDFARKTQLCDRTVLRHDGQKLLAR